MSHTLTSGKNEIIYRSDIEFSSHNNLLQNNNFKEFNGDDKQNNYLNNYNVLTIYSSPVKNMNYLLSYDISEKSDYIIHNYLSFSTYIDKNEEDIKITIKKYLPRYAFYIATDNNLFNIFISGIVSKALSSGSTYMVNLKYFFPFNLRINTDINDFYEFMNFYLINFKTKINIYIKQYYGK